MLLDRFLFDNLTFIAYWGTSVLSLFVALALAGIWRLGRGHRFLVPTGWRRRLCSVFLTITAALLGLGLYGLLGPAAPGLQVMRLIDQTVGKPVPDLAFRSVSDDSQVHLSDFKGKVVLLNLWATWCSPCVEELSALNRLQSTFEAQGLVVVTLSDEEREHLLDFTATHPSQTVNVYDESFAWPTPMQPRPMSFFIDATGMVRDYIFGAADYEFFEERIHQYLDL